MCLICILCHLQHFVPIAYLLHLILWGSDLRKNLSKCREIIFTKEIVCVSHSFWTVKKFLSYFLVYGHHLAERNSGDPCPWVDHSLLSHQGTC